MRTTGQLLLVVIGVAGWITPVQAQSDVTFRGGLGVEGGFLETDLPDAAGGGVGLSVVGGLDIGEWVAVGVELHFQQNGNQSERTRNVWAGPVVYINPGGGALSGWVGIGHLETSIARGAADEDPFGGTVTERARGGATLLGLGVDISGGASTTWTPFVSWTRSDFTQLLTIGGRVTKAWGF